MDLETKIVEKFKKKKADKRIKDNRSVRNNLKIKN